MLDKQPEKIKVLFFGDVVGKLGRRALVKILPELKNKYQPDLVVANIENISHGKGVTVKALQELKEAGLSVFTSGNHVWRKEDPQAVARELGVTILTPANHPSSQSQVAGFKVLEVADVKVLLVNLQGQVFMTEENATLPFTAADEILRTNPGLITVVDIHAEATSEKVALGFYLDGRVSAVMGTHTHVQTADAKILEAGTGYITDVGMTGPANTVLGVKKELIIEKFLTNGPIVFELPETGEAEIGFVCLVIDCASRHCTKIEPKNTIVNV